MVFITVSWTISEKRSAIFLKTVIYSNVLLSKAMEATSSAGSIKFVWSRHVFFCRTFFSARLKKKLRYGVVSSWVYGQGWLLRGQKLFICGPEDLRVFSQNDPKNVFVPKNNFRFDTQKKNMNLVLISCPKTMDHFYWFQEMLSLTKQSAANMSRIQRSC